MTRRMNASSCAAIWRNTASSPAGVAPACVCVLMETSCVQGQEHCARGVNLAAPARRHEGGGVELHHDGRTAEAVAGRERRSEEHTSELQSRQYLVCRLL